MKVLHYKIQKQSLPVATEMIELPRGERVGGPPESPVAEFPDEALPVGDLALRIILLQDPTDEGQGHHKLATLDSAVFLHKTNVNIGGEGGTILASKS